MIVGIWHKVSSCRYEALSFNLDGTYGFYLYSDGRTPETLLESGKYSVNASKGSITLYNRNFDNNKEKLENEERRFSLSTDNKNLYLKTVLEVWVVINDKNIDYDITPLHEA